MNTNLKSFLTQSNSALIAEDKAYKSYSFSSDIGHGRTYIYELNQYANILIADHIYHKDFQYTLHPIESIIIQQYDSIESNLNYPSKEVYACNHYIRKTNKNSPIQYNINKDTKAKLISIQLMPKYYNEYLKKEYNIDHIELSKELNKIPKGIYIPELSFVFNQIRNFKGNKIASKIFYKSKVEEIISILLIKSEELNKSKSKVSAKDYLCINEILEFIENNLHKDLSLDMLADKIFVSPSKFKYIFKRVTNSSLTEYLFNKRMNYACDLLVNTNYYVTHIAKKTGYKSSSSFTVSFKKYTGILPTEYRNINLI